MRSSVQLLYLIRILPGIQLSLGLAQSSVSLRQAIRSLGRVGVVHRDFRPLREEVVAAVIQPVVGVSADNIGSTAVRVVSCVALFTVRYRQIF